MKMHNKKGYIIPLTLLIISLAVVIITAVVRESFSYQRQARITQDKARARLLVLSSLELMLSQLSFIVPHEVPEEKKEAKPEKKPPTDANEKPDKEKDELSEPLQKWMLKVLPLLNRWHTLELVSSDDMVEGTITYYLSSEQGKINLDTLLAEVKKPGKKEKKEEKEKNQPANANAQPGSGQAPAAPGQQPTPSQPAQPAGQAAAGQKQGEQKKEGPEKPGDDRKKTLVGVVDELFKKEKEVSIREALKSLGGLPEDPTDLIKVPKVAALKDSVFVTQEMPKKPLFLMDLFTTHEDATKINPWLLSQSLKTLLDVKENKEVKIDKKFIKNLKPKMNWAQDWDKAFAKLYGKKFAALEKPITELFATEFEATAFSVVCYCTVGTVTQRVGVLIELTEPSPELSPKSFVFKVTRLYWL